MRDEFEEGYVLSEDAQLHYQSHGTGTAFVMLHGSMQDKSYFDRQIEYFSNRFRVITIDSRGHGKSTFGEKPLTIDVMANDIINVMEQLCIKKAILLGFSDGGNIALQLALKQPERLYALVVIGANFHPDGLKPMMHMTANIFYHLSKLLAFIEFFSKMSQKLFLIVKEPVIDAKQLRMIDVPTLLVAGQYDLIKESHTRKLAELIPNATLKIVKGAGHLLINRKPAEINVLLAGFVDSILKN
jgi:pimeloyl-ACP methyl ester carboxylesterase